MAGRLLNPGEAEVGELIDQRNVLNRTIRAQVIDVSGENGYVVLNYDAQPSGGKYATVQPLWASFPQYGGAAWGRFMPQRSDIVKVSFDYDDHPHIVGYDIIAHKDGVADGRSGWPMINGLYNSAKAAPNSKVTVTQNGIQNQVSIAKFGQFTPLKPGEYDFMSSGGAYIYGSNLGKLYMAGGNVTVSLVKNEQIIVSTAQLWTHKADNCDFRFGQVRRTNPSTGLNSIVSSDPNGLYKEFSAILQTTTAPGTMVNLSSLRIGNVVTDLGAVDLAPSGSPLRYSLKTYNSTGIEVYSSSVDDNGNWVVRSPSIKFEGELGTPPATHPLLLTQVYRPAEDTAITGLATQIQMLANVVSQIATVLQSGGSLASVPISGAMAMGAAFVAAAPAMLAGAASVASAAPSVASTFTNAGSTYLSTITKTG